MGQLMSSVVNKTRNLLLFITVLLAGCGGAEETSPPPRSEEPATPVVESPAPKSEAEAVATFVPNRLKIPTIDVDAKVEVVGRDDKGRMDVPKQTDQVGWYQYGAKANQTGNVILAGHLDDTNGPAVFYDLAKVKRGQRIEVNSKTGEQVSYVVTNVMSYPVDQAPVGSIFGATLAQRLTLITCVGTFTQSKGYDQRLVVTAEQEK
ncbi:MULTISPECIES: class F sortase [Exiguobacterium]|uniref:class F sortase n=1 Tax=Exiguobacterium TaxID=33986 RepID=UPI001F486A49|nr:MULTISPECIES: class F sortase [Exiguobacterium]MCK2158293.1 class F sortase [Exiguobacterium sp. 17-1]